VKKHGGLRFTEVDARGNHPTPAGMKVARGSRESGYPLCGSDDLTERRGRRSLGPVMIELRNVLCPVDFSDVSRRALDHAIAIAGWFGSHLTVVHVYHVPLTAVALGSGMAPVPTEGVVLSPIDRAELLHELSAFMPVDRVAKIPLELTVAEGDPATEILAHARSADMLVMGTHGRSGLEHLVLGSTTEKLVGHAVCPLLTIPRDVADATPAAPAPFHRIVAAIDFSEASLRALRFAVSLAEEADAHLTLLHVADIPKELAQWAETSAEGRHYVEQWKEHAYSRLRALVPDEARAYCHVEERVEAGPAAREILRAARDSGAGLVVIGAHGHGVVNRMFVGSTAQHIVQQATCPVLTIRSC
jgi:nucleotide-binding universal stress UspA family protein